MNQEKFSIDALIKELPKEMQDRMREQVWDRYGEKITLDVYAKVRMEINSAMACDGLRALTLQEPWASMVWKGMKTIETRKWPTSYRGDMLVTVSKRPKSPMAGKAIAIVKVVDCRPMVKEDEVNACCEVYPKAWSWFLEDIRQIHPFPLRGRLGLWTFNYYKEALRARRK